MSALDKAEGFHRGIAKSMGLAKDGLDAFVALVPTSENGIDPSRLAAVTQAIASEGVGVGARAVGNGVEAVTSAIKG